MFQLELKRLQSDKDALIKELEIEKEKCHAYQASFEQLQKQGISMAGSLDHEVFLLHLSPACLPAISPS